MKFLIYTSRYKIPKEQLLKIELAANSLNQKLINIDVNQLNISNYNKRYLNDYIKKLTFYLPLYAQLMAKAIENLKCSVEEAIFVDYGGGTGLLSAFAKEVGFKTVIYNDIYDVSVSDAAIILKKIGIAIDHFVCGSIETLKDFTERNNISPSILCSMDVLEHIYNVNDWYSRAMQINGSFAIVFTTSANSQNPIVSKRLKNLHNRAEYIGREKHLGWKERDLERPFLEVRRLMIYEYSQSLSKLEIDHLAKATRGQMQSDIQKSIDEYLEKGAISFTNPHSTNTCDPYTGNWAEHLINTDQLKNQLKELGFEVKFENNFYSYSKNLMVNLIKWVLNLKMALIGRRFLFISPSYTLIATKN